MPYGFNVNILIMPILSTFLLKIFYPIFSLKIAKDDGNYHIYSLFKYIFENLTYGEFNRLFVLLGGAGIGLALLVSLFLYSKDKSIRTIVNISIPFSIFNINTLLIYAVVVFNRYLLLPFLLLPLANLIIAYIVLNIFTVDFTNYYVVWTTPTFIDSYLKTNGDLFVVYLQAYLLFFDITG
jgi:cellobiose-specific phosphotransferase system component IIC